MDPNLQAVLLWQQHQTTTPFMPRPGSPAATVLAADPRPADPPDEEENGEEEEEEENNEEEEEQGGEKH